MYESYRHGYSCTFDTALGLGLFFNMSAQFWLGLQMDYDLDVAGDQLEARLITEVQAYAA